MKIKFLFLSLILLVFTSCLQEELAFTVEASPVLGLIAATPADEGMIAYTGTFYELDKTGILDANIGIDSLPLANLELVIEDQERNALQTIVTDASGSSTFSVPATDLEGVTRLEWTGTYSGQSFRILKNL